VKDREDCTKIWWRNWCYKNDRWNEESKSYMTQQDFYEKHGFNSCFECDEIFTDVEELKEHESKHLEEETWLK
jgi:hypothetical protein